MKFKYCFLFLFLIFISLKGFSTHIIGGEIFYDCLGNNTYKITLKVYRDCTNPLNAGFDIPAHVFIFDASGNFIDSISFSPLTTVLPVTINNPCASPPVGICVEEAIYTGNVVLPPLAGGYDLVYQRCCRNGTILNIVNPGAVGSTFMTHIPGPSIAVCNSSPRFKTFPPIFLCIGYPLVYDHSATDPDGDSLFYELCDPFTGLSAACPILGPPAVGAGCPGIPTPPPYAFVPFSAPYSAINPMSAAPVLAINSSTGLMTGTPNMLGQWVVGVCVSEFRNGVFINKSKRDFQFNVSNCPNLPVAAIISQTTYCFGYNVTFNQNSTNATSFHWDFGDPNSTSDTSNLSTSTYTYADSGTYTVTLIINPNTPCADTQSSTFYIYPLLAPTVSPPVGQCLQINNFNFNAGGAFMGNGTFNWNFGANANPSTSNSQNPNNVIYNAPGTYAVTLTVSENGCTKTVTTNVSVYPKPTAYFGLTGEIGCSLQPTNFIDSSSTAPLTYLWDLGNGTTSTLQNPSVTYSNPGTYNVSLIVTNSNGCKDTFALPNPITQYVSPVAGFNVTPKDTTIEFPNINMTDLSTGATACTVYWGDGTSGTNCNDMHTYTDPGTYTIMQIVENANGCYDTAYSTILIRPLFLFWIPNAFTPNTSPGLNDVFKPVLKGVRDYNFMIFDRWGEKLFETNNIYAGWDGTYKNRRCVNDVFVYKITFTEEENNTAKQYIGNVTLVR